MYGAVTRESQWDLALSPREESQLQSTFMDELRRMATSPASPQNSLWREISQAARDRSHVGGTGPNTLTVPTNARIWRPSRQDQVARLKIQARDATVGGSAAALVATDNISFAELLRNRLVAFQLGATRLSGLVGNCTIPKQTGAASAYWLSTETTAITEGNQTFAQLPLTPRTVAAFTQISRLLQLQSAPDAQQLIINDLAQQVAIAADLAILNGGGTEQPTGIIQTPNIGTVDGTEFDFADILEFQSDVASANGLNKSCAYACTPAVAALAMTRPMFAGGSSLPIWQGSVSDGQMGGFRAMSSMQVPTGGCLFGAWDTVVVGEWGVLEIAVSPFDDFAKGLTGIRCMYTMDVQVRYAGAWSWAAAMS